MGDREQFETKTRAVFHELHTNQSKDELIWHRLTSLLTTEYLGLEKDFFHGKECLDAGCGSNANATYSMLEMGAQKVIAFDLNETIFEVAPRLLKEFDPQRYDIRTGNVLEIDFPDGSFDFVHCGGVLHHSADSLKGLQELVRVTRQGGYVYIHIYGSGGIIRDVTTFFRDKYQQDGGFQQFIDNLTADQLRGWAAFMLNRMEHHGDPLAASLAKVDLDQLLDDDLVLTIKDRIMAPVYTEHTEEELRVCFAEAGCTDIRRLSRYPKFDNIRRLLSPFYEDYGADISRFLYGSGYIQLLARKTAG